MHCGDRRAGLGRLAAQHSGRAMSTIRRSTLWLRAGHMQTARRTCSWRRRSRSRRNLLQHLGNAVTGARPWRTSFQQALSALKRERRCAVDPERSVDGNHAGAQGEAGARIVVEQNRPYGSCPRRSRTPSSNSRATRAAQARDGAAMVARFLHWLRRGGAHMAAMDELASAASLRSLRAYRKDDRRAEGHLLRYDFGRGSERSDLPLPRERKKQSAARTPAAFIWSIPAGSISTAPPTSPAPCGSTRRKEAEPTAEMRDRFNPRAEGAHIALTSAVFPEGTSGASIGRCWRGSSFGICRPRLRRTAPATASAAISVRS